MGENAFATDVLLTRRDARRVELNGERLSSGERLRHELTTLVFTPDRLAVVKGGPATRRAYFDRARRPAAPGAGCARERVPERSRTTKRRPAPCSWRTSIRDALTPWTERVVELGEALVRARADAIDLLSPAFAENADELGLDAATLRYEGEPPTPDDFAARIELDLERGSQASGRIFTTSASRREVETSAPSGRKASSEWPCCARPRRGERTAGAARCPATRPARRRPVGARRRSPPLAGAHARAGSQTVVTATAAAALPVEPAQALSVTPGQVR